MTMKNEKWKITSGQFSDGNLVHEKPSGCQQLPGYLKKVLYLKYILKYINLFIRTHSAQFLKSKVVHSAWMHSLCFYVCSKVAGDDRNNYKHFMQWLRPFSQQQELDHL